MSSNRRGEEISFDRDQPMLGDLPEREAL